MCYKLRIYELTDRGIVCDKAYFDLKNFRPWELTHELLALISPPFIFPTPSIPYPARHIPSFGGAWGGYSLGLVRPYSRLVQPPISSRFLSHPLLSEGLGEAPSLWFWAVSLFLVPPSLSISFLLAFPSTPFCVVKEALLQCKRASFDV